MPSGLVTGFRRYLVADQYDTSGFRQDLDTAGQYGVRRQIARLYAEQMIQGKHRVRLAAASGLKLYDRVCPFRRALYAYQQTLGFR